VSATGRKKSLWIQWIEYVVYRVMALVLRFLSVEQTRRLGEWTGALACRLFPSRTRVAVRNLAATFPAKSERECDEIATRCWRHFSGEILVYVRELDKSAEEVAGDLDLVGKEHLEKALGKNRGLIVYSAHFGNWETAVAILPTFGLPFTAVARPLDNELIDRDARKGRERAVKVVPRREAARALVGALKKREGVVVLPDQAVFPHEGLVVPFLGRPAWTTSSPARMALHFGAPILGVFCVPERGRTRVELQLPILPDELSASERNEEFVTLRINDAISAIILRYPEYWLWMHDRWKRAPDA